MSWFVWSRRMRVALTVAVVVLLVGPAAAAVPGEVQYQGLLLDSLGSPVNGSVDLDFELFDAITGGASLWAESHTSVPVLDGVYEVALGSATPFDSSALSGGNVFLEVTVDSETMAPRQQLLAVPYALRSATTDAVSGLSGAVLTEIYEHFDFDGDPPSTDPREGLGDTDGDGIANFVDSDNDNDLIPDAVEEAQSSDINVPTPNVIAVAPSLAAACVASNVQVQGTTFEAGSSVVVGGQMPVPSAVTPTTLDISVGPAPAGFVPVLVTNLNGESSSRTDVFQFDVEHPVIDSFAPDALQGAPTATITVTGSGFDPGMTVVFGAETPTPYNVSPTSFDVDINLQPTGTAAVTVTNTCGNSDTDFSFSFNHNRAVFVTSTLHNGGLGGAAGADAICAARAAAGGLSGTYLAWIADGVNDPASRFDKLAAGYALPLSLSSVVANDWADLTDGTLDVAINKDEFGNGAVGRVWTGVAIDGAAVNAADPNTHCNGFTDGTSTVTGVFGSTAYSTERWTHPTTLPTFNCQAQQRIYCFQQ